MFHSDETNTHLFIICTFKHIINVNDTKFKKYICVNIFSNLRVNIFWSFHCLNILQLTHVPVYHAKIMEFAGLMAHHTHVLVPVDLLGLIVKV